MKDYKKYFKVKANPNDVYKALTNRHMIEIWSGESAVMDEVAGSEFSLWDGSISGKNLEFVKNSKIVQEWYFGDQEEPSIVTMKFHFNKNETSVELQHTNIPDEAYSNIAAGWKENYFNSLKQMLE